MKSMKKILLVLVLTLGVFAVLSSCNSRKATCPAYSKVDVHQTEQNG